MVLFLGANFIIIIIYLYLLYLLLPTYFSHRTFSIPVIFLVFLILYKLLSNHEPKKNLYYDIFSNPVSCWSLNSVISTVNWCYCFRDPFQWWIMNWLQQCPAAKNELNESYWKQQRAPSVRDDADGHLIYHTGDVLQNRCSWTIITFFLNNQNSPKSMK